MLSAWKVPQILQSDWRQWSLRQNSARQQLLGGHDRAGAGPPIGSQLGWSGSPFPPAAGWRQYADRADRRQVRRTDREFGEC